MVLQAPPGAGKTTVVPLALLDSNWLRGDKIVMLEPRRVAARAAATWMAASLGEEVGQTVGYRIRHDTKVGPETRVEVITEGVFTRILQSDPTLAGIGLVIFDEFHERSLDSDLGLALTIQSRTIFRQIPLKLLLMSATLDGQAVAALLGDAPVISSQGRQFPVDCVWGSTVSLAHSIVGPTVDAVGSALARGSEGILVFLPGKREIRAVQRRLQSELGQADSIELLPLHGSLDLAQQQQAVAARRSGSRKIVLATNIAETSLTILDIDTVVDTGLVREAVFDSRRGMSQLVTRRISRASAAQRAGRAGRLGPGYCYRLWSGEQHNRLVANSTAEILQADLAPLVLQLLAWGESDPDQLSWLDPPPQAAWQRGLQLLADINAAEPAGNYSWRLTAHGERMAKLPLHPRMAHMVLLAAQLDKAIAGILDRAALIAAILASAVPAAAGSADLNHLVGLVSTPGRCSVGLQRWVESVLRECRRVKTVCRALQGDAEPEQQAVVEIAEQEVVGLLVASAYPERIARLKSPGVAGKPVYQLGNGRAAIADSTGGQAPQAWLAVADCGGHEGAAQDRIYLAASLNPALFDGPLCKLVTVVDVVGWDDKKGRLLMERRRQVGQLTLAVAPLSDVSKERRVQATLAYIRRMGSQCLPFTEGTRQWQARVLLLREHSADGNSWPDLSDESLLKTLEQWLGPYVADVHNKQQLQQLTLKQLLLNRLPWPLPKELDQLAPERFTVPSGSSIAIDYCQRPPVLAVKLQEMFGVTETPTVAGGNVALQLQLLSPAGRPLQLTQDLGSFWRNGYDEVKKAMRGRYPKHPWPDDPLAATATRHTKARQASKSPPKGG